MQVVTVYNGLPGYGITTGLDQEGAESIVREAMDAIQEDAPTVLTKGEIFYGVAGPVLSDCSEGASTLVVGTRGRGQIAEAFLGSISEYVVHHTHCRTIVRGADPARHRRGIYGRRPPTGYPLATTRDVANDELGWEPTPRIRDFRSPVLRTFLPTGRGAVRGR